MKKKKVLFTATVVKTHIMEFHIPYLRMFQEMGWETAVAARNDYEDPADCQIPCCDAFYDIPFERHPFRRGNFRAYRMLKQIISEGEYDLIHCHTPVGAMITRLAAAGARRRGTKVIYTAHGFHFFRGAPLINWLAYYPAERLLARLTDVLVTINREDYAFAKKHIHAKRIEYVPGVGVDTEKFRAQSGSRDETRRALGLEPDAFLILTVAEMTRNKNHTTVLKALALLKDCPEFAKMRYLICGQGQRQVQLQAEAAALGVAEHVLFLGYQQDVARLYGCSDLFAFMSYREGLPVALMEAMSSGLPSVCTRIRGNTDLIDDGVDGIFVENRPRALADAILALYRDPERRARLGSAAAKKASRFDARNVHQQMRKIYHSI